MALTVKRFLALIALGMAAVLAMSAGGIVVAGDGWREATPGRLSRARRHLTNLNGAIAALERRDSIAAALRARPPAPGLTIVLPAGGTPALRDETTRIVRAHWDTVAGAAKAYPVIVLVRSNTLQSEVWRSGAPAAFDVTLIPDPPTLNACVIDVWAPRDVIDGRPAPYLGTGWLRRAPHRMAACAVIARYGLPGAAVSRWLNSESWRAAAIYVPVANISGPVRVPPDLKTQPRSTGSLIGASMWRSAWYSVDANARWNLGFAGVACLAGRDDACAGTLRAGEDRDYLSAAATLLPDGMIRRSPYSSVSWSLTLLASIERSLGPEKFAQFWRSPDEPEVALEKLVPGGIASIVRERLEESLLPVSSNPWPTPLEWLAHLGLIGVAAGLMSLGARSRTMKV